MRENEGYEKIVRPSLNEVCIEGGRSEAGVPEKNRVAGALTAYSAPRPGAAAAGLTALFRRDPGFTPVSLWNEILTLPSP